MIIKKIWPYVTVTAEVELSIGDVRALAELIGNSYGKAEDWQTPIMDDFLDLAGLMEDAEEEKGK